jgi:hypothetical protein
MTFETMTQRLFFGLTILLATSCSERPKTNLTDNLEQQKEVTVLSSIHDTSDEIDSIFFTSPYDTLRQIEFPWDTSTDGGWLETASIHVDNFGIVNDDDFLKHPYRKVYNTKYYKAVIFISSGQTGPPALVTIGKDQKPIDTLVLLGKWGDDTYEKYELVTINSDKTITLFDSLTTRTNVNDKDAKNLFAQLIKFKVLDNGSFKKIE